jgi:hypothetical protein
MVEEDPHAGGASFEGSGFREAQLGVLEHRLDLLTSHAREPGEEVVHARSVLDVLERAP